MQRITSDVPKWDVLQYRDEAGRDLPDTKDSPRLKVEDEIFERLYTGALDLLPPEKVDKQMGPWALEFHRQAEEMPRYQRLADDCLGDPFAAAMAADEIAKTVNIPDPKEPEDPNNPTPTEKPMPPDLGALRDGLRWAIQKAQIAVEEAQDAQDTFDGFGWGEGVEASNTSRRYEDLKKLIDGIRSNRKLAEIAKLAGRFRRIAANKRRSRVRHGQDELQDVEIGGEIGRVIPAELVKLRHPKLAKIFKRDYTERKLQQYRLDGQEQRGRGPLILCIDKSGSMHNAREIWASAIACALAQRAQMERRAFGIINYNGGVIDAVIAKPGEDIPMNILLRGSGGGTATTAALLDALNLIEQNNALLGKSDVILLTDGESDTSCAPAYRERAAKLNVQTFGVSIEHPDEVLHAWCDRTFAIQELKAEVLNDKLAEQLFAGD